MCVVCVYVCVCVIALQYVFWGMLQPLAAPSQEEVDRIIQAQAQVCAFVCTFVIIHVSIQYLHIVIMFLLQMNKII